GRSLLTVLADEGTRLNALRRVEDETRDVEVTEVGFSDTSADHGHRGTGNVDLTVGPIGLQRHLGEVAARVRDPHSHILAAESGEHLLAIGSGAAGGEVDALRFESVEDGLLDGAGQDSPVDGDVDCEGFGSSCQTAQRDG